MSILFQVSGLFRDASIGNPINIVVVRLILLEKEEVREPQLRPARYKTLLANHCHRSSVLKTDLLNQC